MPINTLQKTRSIAEFEKCNYRPKNAAIDNESRFQMRSILRDNRPLQGPIATFLQTRLQIRL